YASIQLGIPVDHFETVLNRLRSLGLQVVRETASGQDVTGEYVDLQSRLTNLEATADRVRGFLADANSIDESLQISAQLAELEAQIEQVKGQMYYYEGRSAFSTVTVFLTPLRPTPIPVATPTPAPTPTLIPPWSAADVFDESAETLKENSTRIADKWIRFLVIQGPFVLFGGVMLLGVWIAVRKVRS
ncbi:MAG: DUF4349 domain-containing protein, partial [Gammaproteobacteria bacterium]|nr:DUF4349 domain-containing protein [Gammaproteobacteria bacterium]